MEIQYLPTLYKRSLVFLMPYGPYNNNTAFSDIQHEQMANKYVTQLAAALQEMFPLTVDDLNPAIQGYFYSPGGLTIDDYYKAMAWGGLQTEHANQANYLNGWRAFMTSNHVLSEKYKLIYNNEAFGENNSIVKCN